jgi:hypothetical protein
MASPPPLTPPTRKTTFSFDSSGWMYVYHLGAAAYLQDHILPRLPADAVAFSGSSGGALVGATLALGNSIEELARHIIERQPECEFNPWRMLPCAEAALAQYITGGCYRRMRSKMRVLVTRVEVRWLYRTFPIVLLKPKAIATFGSDDELRESLRASCHIPILGGLRPYTVHRPDGSSRGDFIDGLFWPSILYAWRTFDASDALLKISGVGWPTAHIHLGMPVPPHWIVLPPSQRTLWRLYEAGYEDTAHFFTRGKARTVLGRATARAVLPDAPSPSELPSEPRIPDRMLQVQLMLGWAHLVLLTLLFPLVPPYLVLRSLTRPTSAAELARGEQGGEMAYPSLSFVLQWLRRGLIVSLLLALWPIALVLLVFRYLWPFEQSEPHIEPHRRAPTRKLGAPSHARADINEYVHDALDSSPASDSALCATPPCISPLNSPALPPAAAASPDLSESGPRSRARHSLREMR